MAYLKINTYDDSPICQSVAEDKEIPECLAVHTFYRGKQVIYCFLMLFEKEKKSGRKAMA